MADLLSQDKALQRQREIDTQIAGMHSLVASARVAAAKRLGELQAGKEALLAALDDPHENVRSAAAQALGNFSGSENEQEIIDALLSAIDDPSEKVCQSAIRSLGTLHAEEAREEIKEFLDDANPFICGAAILALARLGTVDQAARLAEFLDDENRYIKMQAVRAVSLLKYVSAGPKILHLLQITRQERLATEQTDLQSRLEWREDDLYGLQNQLIRAAGDLKLNEAAPLLIEIAQKDIGMRGLAVEALIAIGEEIAPELLNNLLSDPSLYLRKRLIMLMIQHNYVQALPLIRPLLRVENASTRSTALQAITQMDDSKAVSEVVWMCFHDSNPFVRVQAVQSLVALCGPDALPYIVDLARDANYQVRRTAVSHLLEWAPVSHSALAALASFSSELPDDELVAKIAAYLTTQNYQAGTTGPAEPLNMPNIPLEVFSEAPTLLVSLDRWRMLLRLSTELDNPEKHKVEEALTLLIDLLGKANHEGNPE